MEEHIDLFQKIITKIQDKVDYADIISLKGNSNSILMKDNKFQNIDSGITTGARIRVLKNGAWGFAYTNDISKLEEITENAIKISNSLSGEVELAEADIIEDKVKANSKIKASDIDIDEKKELIEDANKASNVGSVVSTTASYLDVESEDFFRKIGEKATDLLDATPAPSGRFDIIADNLLTGVFIHEAVGHATEADLMLIDDSVLKDKMNTKIGSDIVNIFDDASNKDAFGYYPYDVEGVKTSKNQLVKNGELVSMLSSRETAAKFGRRSSGNARSAISDQPIVRMSNTYLAPGDMSFEELLEDIKDGIYLKGSRGGQVDTGKGNFQFNATEAYKIENGELKDHYRDVSLSGNILETLMGVDAIGSDFKLSVGFCGKDGQTAPVGDGGPHTKILNAMVGGSS